uniref:Uncharacterized protein n=1 Tax=Timema monikensis TaxID=170555 RepID=A0A7R9E3W4_9NEOP|nr:unnamed protein product [Timema monikensis]
MSWFLPAASPVTRPVRPATDPVRPSASRVVLPTSLSQGCVTASVHKDTTVTGRGGSVCSVRQAATPATAPCVSPATRAGYWTGRGGVYLKGTATVTQVTVPSPCPVSVAEWSGRLTTGLEWSGRLTTGLKNPGYILSVTEWSGRLTTGLEDPSSILSVPVVEWLRRLTKYLQDGEYWEGGHCRTCHSTCETCDGPNEYSCLSCPSPLLLQGSQCLATCLDGSYLDQGVCVPCLHTCKRCTSRVNCSQCAPGLFLQSGECRANCAKGYYSDQGVCEKCYLSCTTCSGPRKDHCINCPQGWKLAAGECQPECPEGEGPLNCTSCPPHYMPQGGLCTRCLSSQYYEATTQTCGPCHDSCKTCAGPNAFSCVTCLSPLQLDTFSQKCVKCCRGGQRKSCCHCDKITGRLSQHFFWRTCHNSSPAGKRRKAVSADQTLRKDHDYHKDSGGTTEELVPFDAMAPLIGSACVAVVMLSVLVLAILQGRSRLKCKLWRSGDGYIETVDGAELCQCRQGGHSSGV